jgi:glycosyltransferase involved in cell wall biosynthesis
LKPYKVSVITSAFKSDAYLETFFHSFLSQRVSESTELILNISSPSSNELDIIRHFSALLPNFRLIVHRNRIPIYRAWNECLSVATGEYIAIWNVDDIRTPESIEKQIAKLDSSEAASVMGAFVITSKFGLLEGTLCKQIVQTHEDYFKGMFHGPFFMFRRSLLHVLKGFDEQFSVAADFDFSIRLASVGSVAYCQDVLGYYLDNRQGASTSRKSVQPIERDAILMRYGAVELIEVSKLPSSLMFDFTSIHVEDETFPIESSLNGFNEIRLINSQNWKFRNFTKRKSFQNFLQDFFLRASLSVAYRSNRLIRYLRAKRLQA